VVGNGTSQFDLTLYLAERAGVLIAWMEYRIALFDAATVEALLAAYEQLLAAAVAAPGTPLSRLPVPEGLARRDERAAAAPAPDARAPLAERRERLAARRAGLSSEQRAALECLRRGEAAGAPERPPGGSVLVEIASAGGNRPAHPPLFCVHGAGGDVQCFFPLARHLGAEQPCYGLQAIGLAPGEEPLASVEEMAALYVGAVRRVRAHGPYLLAGWSFGGLVAFEMAQRLRAAGEDVDLLALLDSRVGLPAAGAASSDPPQSADGGLAFLLHDMAVYAARFWRRDLGLNASELAGRDPEKQLEIFAARAREAGLVHQAGSLAQVRRLVAVLRSNLAAHSRYRPGPYGGRLTLIRAAQGPLAGEPDLGWERLAAAVRLEAPGDHVTMLAEPQVRTLARLLRSAIPTVVSVR
jgi:thioesterase domain-containing protein